MRYLILLTIAMAFSMVSSGAHAANPEVRAIVNGVNDEGDDAKEDGPEVIISEMKVDMTIHGLMADVTVETTLLNPDDSDEIEARYALTLPADAVVTGYALDIDGTLIDAVLLEQPKARQVYEDKIREGIDPGLAEVTKANKFETRIYPIPEEGTRQIRVKFSAPISANGTFEWPLETAAPVASFEVSAKISGVKEKPAVTLPGGVATIVARKGTGWQLSGTRISSQKLDGALKISGLTPRGDMLAARHANNDYFFDITDGATAAGDVAAKKPETVRVYWDSSRSRKSARLDQEAILLSEYLAWADGAKVDLVRFSSSVPAVSLSLSNDQLQTDLVGVTYRGATSFAGLDNLGLRSADSCLLFTDGDATLDIGADFQPDCPLLVIASGAAAGGRGASAIAKDNSAPLLRLDQTNRAEILAALKSPPLAIISARDWNGRRLKFRNLPAKPGHWRVVGELPANGQVELRLSRPVNGRARYVYNLARNGAANLDAPGALWAAQETDRLSKDPADNKKMVKMSREFRVASPSMAFLVLDEPRDYIRADIDAPKGYSKDWREEYRELFAERKESQKSKRDDRFEDVLEEWETLKEWWNEEFEIPAEGKEYDNGRSNAAPPPPVASAPSPPGVVTGGRIARPSPSIVRVEELIGSFPATEAAAEPASMPADSADEEDGGADVIIVSGSRRSEATQNSGAAINAITETDADGNEVEVSINSLLSKRPYLALLDKAAESERLSALAGQEAKYGELPAFYLDTSEWFRQKGDGATARALLLSALDLPTTNDETRLIVAFRLQRMGEHDRAVAILERLETLTTYRPQPKRTLALGLISRAFASENQTQKRRDLEKAFALLSDVALNPAIESYDGIEVISLMEANAIIPQIEAAGGSWKLDERLVALLDTDVRIAIEWTSADADLDLWVVEPTGEKVIYSNPESDIGGQLSNDMTSGYGPEQYVLKKAMPGEYKISVDGYSPDRINPNGPGRVMVRMITDFGRPEQREDLVDAEIRFESGGDDDDDDDDDRTKEIAVMKVAKSKK
ncbi:MAG: VIT domain-containing protein [Sphingorhabdus sp.]